MARHALFLHLSHFHFTGSGNHRAYIELEFIDTLMYSATTWLMHNIIIFIYYRPCLYIDLRVCNDFMSKTLNRSHLPNEVNGFYYDQFAILECCSSFISFSPSISLSHSVFITSLNWNRKYIFVCHLQTEIVLWGNRRWFFFIIQVNIPKTQAFSKPTFHVTHIRSRRKKRKWSFRSARTINRIQCNYFYCTCLIKIIALRNFKQMRERERDMRPKEWLNDWNHWTLIETYRTFHNKIVVSFVWNFINRPKQNVLRNTWAENVGWTANIVSIHI